MIRYVCGPMVERAQADVDEDFYARRFDHLVIRTQIALFKNTKELPKLIEAIQSSALVLSQKTNIPTVHAALDLINAVLADDFGQTLTAEHLEEVRLGLRALQKFIEDKKTKSIVYTDFVDELLVNDFMVAEPMDVAAYTVVGVEQYKRKVREYIESHRTNITIAKLRHAKQLTSADLASLDQMLIEASGQQHNEQLLKDAFGEEATDLGMLIRSIVGMEEIEVRKRFARFLEGTTYNANQIHFVNQVITFLCQNGRIDPQLLWSAPFTDISEEGVSGVFQDDDVISLVGIIRAINMSASPKSAEG